MLMRESIWWYFKVTSSITLVIHKYRKKCLGRESFVVGKNNKAFRFSDRRSSDSERMYMDVFSYWLGKKGINSSQIG